MNRALFIPLLTLLFFVALFSSHFTAYAQGSAANLIENGQSLLNSNQPREARALFEAAITEAQKFDDLQSIADGRYYLGLALYALEDYRGAKDIFGLALNDYRGLPDPIGAARAQHQHGRSYFALGSYTLASDNYYEARRVATGRDDVELAQINMSLGDFHMLKQEYENAVAIYNEAHALFFRLADVENQAAARYRAGQANFALWRLDDAIEQLQEAAAVYNDLGLLEKAGEAVFAVARVYEHRGQLITALGLYEEAEQLFEQSNSTRGLGRVRAQLGRLYHELGYDGAMQLIQQAMEAHRNPPDPVGRAFTLAYKGWIHLDQNELGPALSNFTDALDAADNMIDSREAVEIQALSYHGMALVYMKTWQQSPTPHSYREMDNYFNFSEQRYRDRLKDRWAQSRVLMSRAWAAYLVNDDFDTAMSFLGTAETITQQINDVWGRAEVFLQMGMLEADRAGKRLDLNYDQAVHYYQEAVNLLLQVEDYARAGLIQIKIGELYELQTRYSDARDVYDQAYELFVSVDDLAGQAYVITGLARIEMWQGFYAESYTGLERAEELVVSIPEDVKVNLHIINKVRILILQSRSRLYYLNELYDKAETAIEMTFEEINSVHMPEFNAVTFAYQGDIALAQGLISDARIAYENAIRTSDPRGTAMGEHGLAVIHERQGTDLQAMRDLFSSATDGARRLGDVQTERAALLSQARYELSRALNNETQRDNAIATALTLIGTARDAAGNMRDEGLIRMEFASMIVRDPRSQDALGNRLDYNQKSNLAINEYRMAVDLFDAAGDLISKGMALEQIGLLNLRRSNFGSALEAFREMRITYENIGDEARYPIALLRIGQVYHQQGQYALAQSHYEEALSQLENHATSTDPLFRKELIDRGRVEVLRYLGDLSRETGNFTQALEYLQEAQSIWFGRANRDPLYGLLLSSLGDLALAQGRLNDAENNFAEARSIAEEFNDAIGRGLAVYGLARVYTAQGTETALATQSYSQALDSFRVQAPDPVRARTVALDYGLSLQKRGLLNDAEVWFNQAFNEATAAGDVSGQASARMILGQLYMLRRNYTGAMRAYEEAQRFLVNTDDWVRQGEALGNIADLQMRQGEITAALQTYEQMAQVYIAEGDSVRLAQTYTLIGEAYQRQALYAQALEYHERAQEELNIARQVEADNPLITSTEATVLRNKAAIEVQTKNYGAARQNLEAALSLASQTNDERQIATIEHLLGNIDAAEAQVQQDSAKYRTAIEHYQVALESYNQRDEEAAAAAVYLDIGDAYFALWLENKSGNSREQTLSQQNYRFAEGIAARLSNHSLMAQARQGIARIILERSDQQLDLAVSYLRPAVEQANNLGNRALESSIRSDLGWALERQGNLSAAVEEYTQAIELIERVHFDIRLRQGQIAFAEDNVRPYHRLFAYYYETGDFERAFEYAERSRARTLLFEMINGQVTFNPGIDGISADLLQEQNRIRQEINDARRRLEDYRGQLDSVSAEERSQLVATTNSLQEDIDDLEGELAGVDNRISLQNLVLAQVRQIQTASLNQIRNPLDEDTILVSYYIIPEDGIYAFVIGKDLADFTLVRVTQNLNRVNRLIENNLVADKAGDPTEDLTALYNLLIAPLENHLGDAKRLVIAPHSSLNQLSFSALTTDGITYLSDRFEISYAQNATFYNALAATRSTLPDDRSSALVLGNPSGTGLAALPNAGEEAVVIASVFSTDATTGATATETFLRNNAGAVDVIHIAAHGIFVFDNPLASSLELAPDTQNDGHLQAREIYMLNLHARAPLVVLSACDTAVGAISAGDEIQSLSRAFLVSGARSVVASLWQVDDASTRVLMEQFYANWRNGMSEAEALAAAQAYVRNHSEHDWRHPYYWSGLIYVGAAAEIP